MRTMPTNVQFRSFYLGTVAAIALSLNACTTTQEQQVEAPTAPDDNAVKIIHAVKEEPSVIHGGGMIYELFVGTQFNAKYNDNEGKLTLTDLETKTACEYGTDGMLKVPEDATSGFVEYCANLSSNTFTFLSE